MSNDGVLLTANCQTSNSQVGNTGNRGEAKPPYRWDKVTDRAAFPTGYNYPVYVIGGKMIAMHAESIWESTDGKDWKRSVLPTIRKNVYQSEYVQFRDAIYSLGDNTGNYERMRFSPRIRKTTDVKQWQELAKTSNLPPRIFAGAIAFKDKIWILGGYDGSRFHNDVWNSADGITWTQVVKNAGWSPRNVGTLTEFNGKLLIIGGGVIDGMTNPNPDSDKEIWSSTDGVEWKRETSDLQKRSGGSPVVFDSKLWLVGANRDGSFARSSLVSDDGAIWNEETAPWSPRGGAAAWVFEGKLYMTGGKYSVTEKGQIRFIYSNDVWRMSKVG